MSAVFAAAQTRGAPGALQWPALAQPFAELGGAFSVAVDPVPLPDPVLLAVSNDAAALVGLQPPRDASQQQTWAQAFGGHPGPLVAHSRATVYAGHQFGNWAGRLGDGRALLLGQWPAAQPYAPDFPDVWEVQLKGSGPTPFSRMGDGWAVLRSSIREFLCSEAMAALGIPTTRALCLVGSTRPVRRERIETAAIVTRLAPSFIRFGHFEHFSYSGQSEELRRLVDWVIARHAPHCAADAQPALALLRWVTVRTARLIAQWQAVGFVHGVMNTDNMSILGWTIDYGPFGFVDAFDPFYTPNTTDREGRYAYARQPAVARWNLLALAQSLLPLIGDPQAALAAVQTFDTEFEHTLHGLLCAKLGLQTAHADDAELLREWMGCLAANRSDWTFTFRALATVARDLPSAWPDRLAGQFSRDRACADAWLARYVQRLRADGPLPPAERAAAMNRVNPAVVPRHHVLQAAIARAEAGEASAVPELLQRLRKPFDEQPDDALWRELAAPPPPDAPPACLSCSS